MSQEDIILSIVPDSLEVQEHHPIANLAHNSHSALVALSQNAGPPADSKETHLNAQCSHTPPIPEHTVAQGSLSCHSLPTPSPLHASALEQESTSDNIYLDKTECLSLPAIPDRGAGCPVSSANLPANNSHKDTHPTLEPELALVASPGSDIFQTSPFVKEESQDLGIDLAANTGSSRNSSRSSLGKRRRSRLGESVFGDEVCWTFNPDL